MPLRTRFPATTHQWLKPLYTALNNSFGYVVPSGASGIPNALWLGIGVPLTQVGNSTGVVGLYGFSGLPQIGILANGGGVTGGSNLWSGSSGILATGIGASGFLQTLSQIGFNGGTGTLYSLNDIVRQLKNMGALTP